MPGDIKYRDVNGDGIIDENDEVPLGYTETPNLTYGFGGSAVWKDWDINILFQGSGKSSFFLSGYSRPFSGGESGNVLTYVADQENRWTSHEISGTYDTERTDALFPRLTYGKMRIMTETLLTGYVIPAICV